MLGSRWRVFNGVETSCLSSKSLISVGRCRVNTYSTLRTDKAANSCKTSKTGKTSRYFSTSKAFKAFRSFGTPKVFKTSKDFIISKPLRTAKSFSSCKTCRTSKISNLNASSSNLRNIGIVAHIDAGKTTTTERMLYYSGLTKHIGDVDQGDTVMDYLPQERNRGITITSAAITFNWDGHRINLIDTPGHADFTFEVVRAIRVLDGVVAILDGVAGVEAQTEKVWKQANEMNIPRLVYVNKMDRQGAGFGRTVREVVAKLNTKVAIINLPYFTTTSDGEQIFQGIVDVIDKKVIVWESGSDGKDVIVKDVSECNSEIQQELINARTALVESLSELNEDLVEEFLEIGDYMEISSSSLKRALRQATIKQQIVPVLCGASFQNIGVQPLLESIVSYLPSPNDLPAPQAVSRIHGKKGQVREEEYAVNQNVNKNLCCALAFKVINDPIRGFLVFVRVYSGTLHHGCTVFNTATGTKERVSRLLQMQANNPIDVSKIETGNIGVIMGSKQIRTGDTLVAHNFKRDGSNSLSAKELGLHLKPIKVPPPVFFASIDPISVQDTNGMQAALDIVLREDPSLHLSYDEENGQTLISGMGELHLEIAQDRIVNDLKANAIVGKIMVSYKETIVMRSKIFEHTINSPTGSVNVKVSVEPNDGFSHEDADNFDQDNNIIVYPSLFEHLLPYHKITSALKTGAYPVFSRGGKRAKLSLHSVCINVHSVELSPDLTDATSISTAIRLATNKALESLSEQQYSLLEPLMDVRIIGEQEDIGDLVNDITGLRQGHILSVGDDYNTDYTIGDINYKDLADNIYVPPDYTMYLSKHNVRMTSQQGLIRALVPLRTMIGYVRHLRSITQGRGTYLMTFEKYERVSPENNDAVLTSMEIY